jgi:hypothetical protein
MNVTTVLLRVQRDEKGSILILTLMLLAILTVLGLAATQSSWFEVSIATNDRLYRDSFAAAESTVAEVIADTPATGADNLSGVAMNWPDDANARATVQYQGDTTAMLRGEGDSANKLKAHVYQIEATGTAQRGGRSTVAVAGYRIGF